jgi:ATP-dependent RNA helicase DeaD
LLHHLRVGDGSPAAKAPREEERERPAARPPYREERQDNYPERHDRKSQFDNRRDDRRAPAPIRERPLREAPVKASQPARPAAIPSSSTREVKIPASAPAPKIEAPAKESPPVEKTYSDDEILKSVAPPAAPKKEETKPSTKPSRRTPDNQTRLWMNVGEEMGVAPIDIVNAVAGETGLPGKVVGLVDVRERHLFADVASEHVKSIIAKLNRSEIKGHKLKVKVA